MQGVTNQANSSLKHILEQHGISGTPTLLQQLVSALLPIQACSKSLDLILWQSTLMQDRLKESSPSTSSPMFDVLVKSEMVALGLMWRAWRRWSWG